MDVARLIDDLRQPTALLGRDGKVVHGNAAFESVFGSEPSFLASLPAVPFRDHRVVLGSRILICDGRDIEEGALLSFEERTDTDGLTKLLRFQRLLQASLAHALYLTDAEFRFRSFNRAAEQLLGWSASEVIGKPTDQFVEFVDNEARISARRTLQNLQPVSFDTRVIRKDGTHVEVFFAVSPILEEDNSIVGYSVLMNDIGVTKRLEKELRDQARALEEANHELESFSASVSHDLRSPLRAIDGFTRIILDDYGAKMEEDERRLFGNVRRNADKMGRLIDELLEFSRLGRRTVEHKPVDMNALARAAVEQAKEPNRVIEVQLGALPGAVGDRALLLQVWVNLIENAVKYTRQREKAIITIGGEQRGDELVYWVEDNGAGFDMKYVGQLFGVFNRLHSSADFEGTGVGLALVRRIVRRHDGEVVAEGVEDKGAKFTFSLPTRVTAT